MAPIKHPLGPELPGPIAQVLGRPSYQVLTEQGFGLMLLGPTPLTWAAQDKWRHPQCGPALVAQFAVQEQFQKLHRFPNFAAPFSQNEIARFFQRSVISKITF